MEFSHRYLGGSRVSDGGDASALSFAPDLLRPPTFFRGRVREPWPFREAMSALHDVVVSDLRFQPKDRSAYLAWRATQSDLDLAQVGARRAEVQRELAQVHADIAPLAQRELSGMRGYFDARQRYYRYLYERDRELWFKLDPVVTVHPDQVFFECFSRDESSYGRLAARYEGFDELGERAFGTTNVDYSDGLYDSFQKLRSYKTTSLDVDPSGFSVATSGESHREVKIDVPDSWVRGFLQVSAAATLPSTAVDLHPMDIHNLCLALRRNKESFGPRSLRYRLSPGKPVVIVVEPWNLEIRCPRSLYRGHEEAEIRVWGRRRLHILERLLPHAQRVRVHLLGTGLPSFYVLDLGPLSFTLGLSGWTRNNWSASANFDLLASREDVDDDTRERVFDALGRHWRAPTSELASELGLSHAVVQSALGGWVQAGRAIYDLEEGVYRKRELARDPLPAAALRFASEKEAQAAEILHRGKVAVDDASLRDGKTMVRGRVEHRGRVSTTSFVLDADRRLVEGQCTCDEYIRNRLHKGPCDHMLALRAAHRRGISDVITARADVRVEPPAVTPPRAVGPARSLAWTPHREPSFWDWLPAFWYALLVMLGLREPMRPTPEQVVRRALAELLHEIAITNEAELVAELVRVYEAVAEPNARLFALVDAIKQSPHVSGVRSDQTLIRALRKVLP